jgi:hypothetical protein
MLLRVFTLLVFVAVSGGAQCPIPGQELIGRWRGKAEQEITFRSDHTFIGRNGSRTVTGGWRLESPYVYSAAGAQSLSRDPRARLVTIATLLANGKERLCKCTFEVAGDHLIFTAHGAVTVSHGEQLGESKIDFTSTVYERVP